jgi:hypothetical protein
MPLEGWSAGILRCNVLGISASSLAARDIRWLGGTFLSQMSNAADSPEKAHALRRKVLNELGALVTSDMLLRW